MSWFIVRRVRWLGSGTAAAHPAVTLADGDGMHA